MNSYILNNKITSNLKKLLEDLNMSSQVNIPMGIYERGAFLDIEVYIPNLNIETLEIYVGNKDLTIKSGGSRYAVHLPKPVKAEETYAKYGKGILEIVLPKAE